MNNFKSLTFLAITLLCFNTFAEVVNGKYFSEEDKIQFSGSYEAEKFKEKKFKVDTPALDAKLPVCKIEVSKSKNIAYFQMGDELKSGQSDSIQEVIKAYIENVDKGLCHASLSAKTCEYDKDLNLVLGGIVLKQKFSSKEEGLALIKELSITKNDKESLVVFSKNYKNRNICSRSFLQQENYKQEKEVAKAKAKADLEKAEKAKKAELEEYKEKQEKEKSISK